MDAVTLDVEPRSATGKKVRALRRQKVTPIHAYGRGMESLNLQVDTALLRRALSQVGRTAPLTLRVDGDEHFVVVREVQRHPVTDQLLHVDFLQVSRTERMRAEVPVTIEGEAPASRQEGTMLIQDLYSVQAQHGEDLRDEISRAVISSGWSLLSMQTVGMSLEEIFLRLTTKEEA